MKQDIRLTNTLTGKKEIFIPIREDEVSFYHCGPTVYWRQHIGNMRGMVMADLVRRTLGFAGYSVSYVRNYTDVGHMTGDNEGDADAGVDRMEKAAQRENKSPQEIADFYIQQFEADAKKLNIAPATESPRATQFIADMISMVEKLIEDGFAYQTELAVYFDTSKAADYYQLSGQKAESLQSHTGHGDVADKNKKNATDFAVWFFKAGAHAQALQTWKNPFSETEGFPGWHIECSAMAKKLLGDTIDIHMGGIEHVPIHHTNEIAQSEAANGVPFAHYWLHNEHLLVDGKKMSKSEGTSYTVSDIEARGYSALDLRYFFLQAHYRSKQNFTWEALEASKTARLRLIERLRVLENTDTQELTPSHTHIDMFKSAIYDDFNIPGALSLVSQILKDNTLSDEVKWSTLNTFDEVFALGLREALEKNNLPDEARVTLEVEALVEQRTEARKNKDFELSDKLRDKIEHLGYELKDTPDGQQVTKK